MPEKELELVTTIAKAMFANNHHYHSELTWENAHPEHRQFYMNQAGLAFNAVRPYLTLGD